LKPAPAPRRLAAEEAGFRADLRALGIGSSDDLAPSHALGDRRGERALELALRMRSAGYHAFVCGIEGPDRLEQIAALVRPLLEKGRPLRDWVYVHNFREPDRPRALQLPAGDGRRLRAELGGFIRSLREDLPKAFREEAFDQEKAQLVQGYEERQRRQQEHLEQLAQQAGFTIAVTPQQNILLVPVVNGKPIQSDEELAALGPERVRQLDDSRRQLARQIRDHLEQHRQERHQLDEEIQRIERAFAERIARRRLTALAARFGDGELTAHLEELVDHLLDHLDAFREDGQAPPFPLAMLAPEPKDALAIYEVNIVVDNSRTEGPKVLAVDSPTYKNLFGTVDRTLDRFGRLTTDFRRIHPGALLEADGGVVVLNAEDALVEPFVWRILRRALRSGRVEIEAYDPFVVFTPAGIRPEPIQVETKVVLLGPRWLFEMLLAVDEEFRDLFKVLADFHPIVDRDEDATRALCGRVAAVARSESLPAFDAGALEALVELAVREADDRRKLHLGSQRVLEAARESGARAAAEKRKQTRREDVETVIRERVQRLDRIDQAIREAIARGILRVDVEGERVGTLNALSVSELGGHRFGRPTRVSAAVGMGAQGVVSIDRETKLSGPTHDKGVLILQGFLRDRFARGRPLSLSASLVFEQSYGTVEGDSASLAELLALLSRIGGFALRQDLAVTGSVDQNGQVQAVGGLNEKVEGFFDCCAARGLSGTQGVALPASNVEHLVLRPDVVEAVRAGRFQIHPVSSVEQALELFAGAAAGSPDEEDTLLHAIDRSLAKLAGGLREFTAPPAQAPRP
jgi:ATP-dependent Lon protease